MTTREHNFITTKILLITMRIWNREDITNEMESFYSQVYARRVKLEFFNGTQKILDISDKRIKLNEDEPENSLQCVDLSGLSSLRTTIMPSKMGAKFENIAIEDEGWKEWFLNFSTTEKTCLVPDTNMLMRHYFSETLFRKLGIHSFSELRFRIPRLDILEIEMIVNNAKAGSKEKRLGFYAMKEIMFLKDHGAKILDHLDLSLLEGFPNKAGNKFVDAWIRREVQDFISNPPPVEVFSGLKVPQNKSPMVFFLTCDLMNSLAAHAEGINVVYFSRIEEKDYYFENFEELTSLIISSSIVFGKICVDVFDHNELSHSYQFEGMWSGKTPYHWSEDCLRVTHIEK